MKLKLLRSRAGAIISIVVVACGTVGIFTIRHSTPIPYNPKLGWIMISGANGIKYFDVTDKTCMPNGLIGTIGENNQGGNIDANIQPWGAKLFAIKGVKVSQAIAVALDYGRGGYVEAVYVGNSPPH